MTNIKPDGGRGTHREKIVNLDEGWQILGWHSRGEEGSILVTKDRMTGVRTRFNGRRENLTAVNVR